MSMQDGCVLQGLASIGIARPYSALSASEVLPCADCKAWTPQAINDPTYASALGLASSLRILRLVKITARNPDMSIVWRVLYLSWRAMLVPLTSMMVRALCSCPILA